MLEILQGGLASSNRAETQAKIEFGAGSLRGPSLPACREFAAKPEKARAVRSSLALLRAPSVFSVPSVVQGVRFCLENNRSLALCPADAEPGLRLRLHPGCQGHNAPVRSCGRGVVFLACHAFAARSGKARAARPSLAFLRAPSVPSVVQGVGFWRSANLATQLARQPAQWLGDAPG